MRQLTEVVINRLIGTCLALGWKPEGKVEDTGLFDNRFGSSISRQQTAVSAVVGSGIGVRLVMPEDQIKSRS